MASSPRGSVYHQVEARVSHEGREGEVPPISSQTSAKARAWHKAAGPPGEARRPCVPPLSSLPRLAAQPRSRPRSVQLSAAGPSLPACQLAPGPPTALSGTTLFEGAPRLLTNTGRARATQRLELRGCGPSGTPATSLPPLERCYLEHTSVATAAPEIAARQEPIGALGQLRIGLIAI